MLALPCRPHKGENQLIQYDSVINMNLVLLMTSVGLPIKVEPDRRKARLIF